MQMTAVITGVEDFGLFAQGVDLPAEGLIHVSTLADDYYRFDPAPTAWPATAAETAIGWAT